MGASCGGCHAAANSVGQCAMMHAPGCDCSLDMPAHPKTRLRVGCCSGLLDAPIHLALEQTDLQHLAITLNWVRCPPDAGAVMSMLSTGLIDMALMFTEDAVGFVAQGNPLRLAGTYVKTPRSWGVHVPRGSANRTAADLADWPLGSAEDKGATLAASVLADQEGWADISSCSRKTFSSIRRAADSMLRGTTRATLWEKRNVRHLVASGEWEVIGEVTMPWPSVVLVASKEALYAKAGAVKHFISFAHTACEEFVSANEDEALKYLSACHGLNMEEALDFMAETEWVCESKVSLSTVLQPLEHLRRIGCISGRRRCDPRRFVAAELCADALYGMPLHSSEEPEDEDFCYGLPREPTSAIGLQSELQPVPEEDEQSAADLASPMQSSPGSPMRRVALPMPDERQIPVRWSTNHVDAPATPLKGSLQQPSEAATAEEEVSPASPGCASDRLSEMSTAAGSPEAAASGKEPHKASVAQELLAAGGPVPAG